MKTHDNGHNAVRKDDALSHMCIHHRHVTATYTGYGLRHTAARRKSIATTKVNRLDCGRGDLLMPAVLFFCHHDK